MVFYGIKQEATCGYESSECTEGKVEYGDKGVDINKDLSGKGGLENSSEHEEGNPVLEGIKSIQWT